MIVQNSLENSVKLLEMSTHADSLDLDLELRYFDTSMLTPRNPGRIITGATVWSYMASLVKEIILGYR